MTQFQSTNSGARTADWLAHQTRTGALYALEVFLLDTSPSEGSSRQDFRDTFKEKPNPPAKPAESDK